jgi:AcrR family transcriptional regulator
MAGADAKGEVLNAAAHAFMNAGYGGTTLNDIADRLGATKGRVYHYYRSKGGIFLDVIRFAMHALTDRVLPLANTSDAADVRLRAMAREHALATMEFYPYFRVTTLGVIDIRILRVSGAAGTLPSDILALRDEYEARFIDVIMDGVADAKFRRVSPRLAAKEVLGALNWIAIWYKPDGPVGAETIANEFADFVVDGLRPD